MRKFKIGDKVKIRKGTRFYSQSRLIGEIVGFEDSEWYKVKFTNDYKNAYKDEDLEFAEKVKEKVEVFGIVKFCKKYY
jgi:hypothetical protein